LSVTVAVCVSEPLVPWIVSVNVPAGVFDLVVTVSVELVMDPRSDHVRRLHSR